jgi:hypothetical protein
MHRSPLTGPLFGRSAVLTATVASTVAVGIYPILNPPFPPLAATVAPPHWLPPSPDHRVHRWLPRLPRRARLRLSLPPPPPSVPPVGTASTDVVLAASTDVVLATSTGVVRAHRVNRTSIVFTAPVTLARSLARSLAAAAQDGHPSDQCHVVLTSTLRAGTSWFAS